jgi:hypothetical protein
MRHVDSEAERGPVYRDRLANRPVAAGVRDVPVAGRAGRKIPILQLVPLVGRA